MRFFFWPSLLLDPPLLRCPFFVGVRRPNISRRSLLSHEGGRVLLGSGGQRTARHRHGVGPRDVLRGDGGRVAQESHRPAGGTSHGEKRSRHPRPPRLHGRWLDALVFSVTRGLSFSFSRCFGGLLAALVVPARSGGARTRTRKCGGWGAEEGVSGPRLLVAQVLTVVMELPAHFVPSFGCFRCCCRCCSPLEQLCWAHPRPDRFLRRKTGHTRTGQLFNNCNSCSAP